jgi:heme-degrading monooxygenase HmoA
MFIAMNRFKIKPGMEQDFIDIWKQRDSLLEGVPGFKSFNLLQGQSYDDYTLFASHSIWESEQAFEDWTHSEAFRKAHANAGEKTRDVYLGPPQLEWFNAVI